MGVRATFSIETTYGGLTEVELHSAGYAGAVRALTTIAGDTLQHNYDNLNPETIYETPLIKSRVNCTVLVRDDTDRAIIDEIIASSEGTFTLKYDKGGSDFWQGDIVPYLGGIEVRAYPYPVRLTAKDFTPLNGRIYPLSTGRKPVIEVIADIMNLMGYDLPITTATSWVNSGQSNTARDFLGQIYIETRALRDYATRQDDTDKAILAITALEMICRNFKLFAKQVEGRLYLEQTSAYDTPSAVLRTLYDKDGTFVSASTVNNTITAPNASPYRQIAVGSTESYNPAYKRVSYTFNHRQQLQGVVLPEVFRLPESGLTTREFTQAFAPDGLKAVRVGGSVSLGFLSNVVQSPFGQIAIQAGSFYFNNVQRTWSTTPYINTIPLQSTLLGEQGQPEPWNSYVGYYSIETTPVPLGVIDITLTYYQYPQSPVASVIAYFDNEFTIVGDEENQIASSIQYNLEQSANYSTNYDDGMVLYGEGPVAFSDSALSTSILTSSQIIGGWYRRGTANDWTFAELYTREIMEFQVSFVRNLEARLIGDYSPSKTLVYDSTSFFFIGGGWNAYTGEWSANFVANSYSDATADLTVGLISGPTSIGQGFYNAINIGQRQTLEAGGAIAYRTATVLAPGSISLIVVRTELTNPPLFLAGDSIKIVHPIIINQFDDFVVASDQLPGSNVVQVVPQTIANYYPAGSYAFLSSESINAGIIIARNSILLFAKGQAHGELTADISGTVTSITANLFARVREGEDFVVQDALTGLDNHFTAAESVDAGLRTFAIEEAYISAVAGSYIQQDGSQKQSTIYQDPGTIELAVTRNRVKNAIAVLSAELISGPGVVSIPFSGAIAIDLLDNQTITLTNREGDSQDFVVNGNQSISGSGTITVDSTLNLVDFDAGDAVYEAGGLASARITLNSDEIDLRVSFNNVVNSINISTEGIRIAGNRIEIDGDVTFSAGYNPVDGRWVAYQTTAPATRGSGATLVTGDEWFDTDDGNRLRTWSGSAWVATETTIQGSRIVTGSITADKIDVSDLFAQTITVTGTISGGTGATQYTIDNDGVFIGVFGGLLARIERTRIYFETDADPFAPTGEYSSTGVTLEETASDLNPRFHFDITELYLRNSGASATKNIRLQSTGDATFTGAMTSNSIVVGTQTNKATISYTTNEAWTLTIPNLAGNRTFSFIDENETITGTKTFTFGDFLLRNTANNGSATINYGTAGADRTYTFSGANGTVLTTGNYTGTLDSVYLRQDAFTLSSSETLNEWIEATIGGETYVFNVHKRP